MIMAFFRIHLQWLVLVALCSVAAPLLRSVHGRMILVGGDFGWQGNGTDFDYQRWASKQTVTTGDTLNFGEWKLGYNVTVIVQVEVDCNEPGTPVDALGKSSLVEYTFGNAGWFTFFNTMPYFCALGMRFTLNVTGDGSPGGPDDQPPGPPSPAIGRPDGAPASSPPSLAKQVHSNRVGWIVGVVTGVVGVFVLIGAATIMTRRNYWQRLRTASSGRKGVVSSYTSDSRSYSPHNKDIESRTIDWPWGPQRFSYEELNGATDSFNSSLVVGEGGFGTVYKGYIGEAPGAPVAVKRLSQYARQGAREFLAELNIISQLRHRNLVQLVGWCDENEELIIVYEFMPNGDLDDLIFGGYNGDASARFVCLSWKCRLNIFCGVAAALVYLHEEWEQRVVHRDVKTSNVMLDAHFNARLGDFGLARLSSHSQAPRTTMVAGTIGYLAPEFNLTGRATDKTDVYAFGVVILEVACARRPLTSNCILVDLAWDLHKEDKLLDAIDPKLVERSAADEDEMKRTLQVGLLCCHPDPPSRPTMRHVLNILTGEAPLPKMPRSRPVAIFAEEDR